MSFISYVILRMLSSDHVVISPFGKRCVWIQNLNPTQLFTGCVTLGKFVNLSEFRFSLIYNIIIIFQQDIVRIALEVKVMFYSQVSLGFLCTQTAWQESG